MPQASSKCVLSMVACVQVDQLLAPQFREDLVRLDQQVGRKVQGRRQTVLVSATLSEKANSQPTS